MVGLVLYVLATILEWSLSIPAFIHIIYATIRRRTTKKFSFKDFNKTLNKEFIDAALTKDISGNMSYGTMFNDWCIKKGGYHYGRRSESISSATGKNMLMGTLTWFGKGLAGTLNLVDFKNWRNGGHCYVSIKDEAFIVTYPKPKWYKYILWSIPFIFITIPLLYALILLWRLIL